jgi:hypothetical protein
MGIALGTAKRVLSIANILRVIDLTGWPPEKATSQQVQMSVKNALSHGCAGIEDCSITVQTLRLCNLVCRDKKGSRYYGRHLCKGGGILYMDGWNEYHVSRCLWRDVPKSYDVLIAVDNSRRNLTFNDLAEEAIWI